MYIPTIIAYLQTQNSIRKLFVHNAQLRLSKELEIMKTCWMVPGCDVFHSVDVD
jgi:hypothetical protein